MRHDSVKLELLPLFHNASPDAPHFSYWRPERNKDLPPKKGFIPTGLPLIDNAIKRHNIDVRYGDFDSNHFDMEADRLNLWHPEAYDDIKWYRQSVAHELTHWTGGSMKDGKDSTRRLRRVEHAPQPPVGLEEMTAEMGAAFLLNDSGVMDEDLKIHLSRYLKNWVNLSITQLPQEFLFLFGAPDLTPDEELASFNEAAKRAEEAVAYLLRENVL